MPAIILSRNGLTPPVCLNVAIARRNWSASPGVNPAQTIATCIACSWNSGTPSVFSSTRRSSGVGYSTASIPSRRRRYGCTMSPWIGPGRTIATWITRSYSLVGLCRGSIAICARLSIWNVPSVSALRIIANVAGSSCGRLARV